MTIKLIDLYSGNKFVPSQIIADGYTGVIFKAGQGGWADVPRYHPDWAQMAKDSGLMVGWYWLCDSRYHSSVHIREMENFKIFNDVGQLGLWVDMEKPMIAMTEAAYWKTPYAGHRNVVDLVYLIQNKGVKAGIYTGPGAYELIMRGAPKSSHDYLGEHDLWTAQYPYVYIPGISKPKLYGSWKTWNFWQYREGPDINIFNGEDGDFYMKYGGYISPPPVVTPEPPIIVQPTGDTMKGTAKAITNIKPMAGGVAIAQLQVHDYAFGTVGSTDLMNFDHYYKASGARVELGKLCKATLNNLTITNESETVSPPPVPATTEFDKAILVNTKTGEAVEFKLVEV